MATTNNITTTYIGKDSKQFISPIIEAGRTLGVPGVTVRTNVNYRSRITTIALSNLIKDATCDFDPTGQIDQGENWLEVKQLEVELQLCKNDYYNDYIGENMGTNDPIPSGFLKYLVGRIGANVSDSLENMVWKGTDVANSFEGYEAKFTADANVVDVVSAAITSTNVIAEARKVIAAAKKELLTASDTYLYVPNGIFQSLRQSFNDKSNAAPCGEDCMTVDGIKIFLAPGITEGNMVLARKSNLFFGTWVMNDATAVKVIDMSQFGEKNFRFAMTFFAGVGYGYGDEIVFYS